VDGDLVVEMGDAAGHGPHHRTGTGLVDSPVGAVTKPGASFHRPRGSQATQLGAERVVGGDHERFEFVDRRGTGPHGAVPSHHMDPERFPKPPIGPRRRQAGTTQRFACGADGVELIGFRSVFGRLLFGPVELDHPFTALTQRCGQAPPVTRRALDRPGPFGSG
jgi:hypothetical protein